MGNEIDNEYIDKMIEWIFKEEDIDGDIAPDESVEDFFKRKLVELYKAMQKDGLDKHINLNRALDDYHPSVEVFDTLPNKQTQTNPPERKMMPPDFETNYDDDCTRYYSRCPKIAIRLPNTVLYLQAEYFNYYFRRVMDGDEDKTKPTDVAEQLKKHKETYAKKEEEKKEDGDHPAEMYHKGQKDALEMVLALLG